MRRRDLLRRLTAAVTTIALAAVMPPEQRRMIAHAEAEQPARIPAEMMRAPGGQSAGRDLVIATASDINTLDPQESTVAADVRVTLNLFDTLVTRTPDLALKPSLAVAWRPLDDRRWEFTLRDDARFHNGDPVTARDVKYTIERALDPTVGKAVATVFSTVDTVEAPNDTTVTVTTAYPDPLLPARLAYTGGEILPERYLRQVGSAAFAQAPVGGGVVRFESWTPGDRLVLTANPDYWGGLPAFDRVTFQVMPHARDRVQTLLEGRAHIATRLAPEWRLRISRRPEARPAEVLYAGLYALGINVRVAPLDRPEVRQALSLAVDRQSILRAMWLGRGIVPTGFVANGDHVGYAEDWPPLLYNQERARQLLAAAGYSGEPIVFEATDGYLENDAAMAIVLKAMWEQVGLNVRLEALSTAERARKVAGRTFRGVWLSDPTSTLQDPDGMMVRLGVPGGILDYWYDEAWIQLAFEARYSQDPARRDALYRRMQEIMLREMPWIPLIQPTEGYGIASAIQWQPHPTDRLELRRETLMFAP